MIPKTVSRSHLKRKKKLYTSATTKNGKSIWEMAKIVSPRKNLKNVRESILRTSSSIWSYNPWSKKLKSSRVELSQLNRGRWLIRKGDLRSERPRKKYILKSKNRRPKTGRRNTRVLPRNLRGMRASVRTIISSNRGRCPGHPQTKSPWTQECRNLSLRLELLWVPPGSRKI